MGFGDGVSVGESESSGVHRLSRLSASLERSEQSFVVSSRDSDALVSDGDDETGAFKAGLDCYAGSGELRRSRRW